MSELSIRDAEMGDVEAITAIQNAFVRSAAIEWTDVEYTAHERREWLTTKRGAGHPVLVGEVAAEVVGWTSFGEFRDTKRWPGYRLTVEHTIHVREDHWGGGIGRQLIHALVERATGLGFHVMVAAVDGENESSLRFHRSVGFTEVARMPQVGTKFGRWLDLVLLQRILGEKSPPAGNL